MQSASSFHHQKRLEPLGHALRVAERHHALVALGADDLRHDVRLVVLAHVDAVLRDIGLILLLGLHGDLLGVALVHPADVHDLARDGRGEHTEVAAGWDLVQNTGHVVDEAHVEHSVGLVEHNGLHPVEPHGAALHVVGQAARGRHNDLRLFLQRVDLLANGRAAVEAHHADAAHKNGQVAQLRRDLHGKLARGRHDDRLHLLAFGVNVLDDGNAEGKGLARAGGALAITSFHSRIGGMQPACTGVDHSMFFFSNARVISGSRPRLSKRTPCVNSIAFSSVFSYFQSCMIISRLSIR